MEWLELINNKAFTFYLYINMMSALLARKNTRKQLDILHTLFKFDIWITWLE